MPASAAGSSRTSYVPAAAIPANTTYLDLVLQCPRCGVEFQDFHCPACSFHLRYQDGIVHSMPPERVTHYARFMEDYEQIRAAEGRGSDSSDFYLSLPYADVSGRNSKQWKIRARSYDYLIEHILRPNLPASGARVLDLGAGNCWMSFRLAAAGYRPCAVDLLINDRDGLGAAEHYRNHLAGCFPRFQAELSRLPFQTEQFQAVVFNASFHYAEDDEAALGEALRCVQPGGIVAISDTPWYSCEESGRQMVSERRAAFRQRYGTPSDSIRSIDYLTDERLRRLEARFSIQWTSHTPPYGFRWAMRPLVAKLRNKREPSQFRIYVARKDSA
jgi:SAM-dependent methyltransferase